MEDHSVASLLAFDWESVLSEANSSGVGAGRVFTVVTSVKSRHYLSKDGPDKFFIGVSVSVLEVLDHDAKIAVAAVFHVEMQVVRFLVVFLFVIVDDIRVIELSEDVQLSLELVSFLVGHFGVAYFLATQDLATVSSRQQRSKVNTYKPILLPPHLPNHSKGSLSCTMSACILWVLPVPA